MTESTALQQELEKYGAPPDVARKLDAALTELLSKYPKAEIKEIEVDAAEVADSTVKEVLGNTIDQSTSDKIRQQLATDLRTIGVSLISSTIFQLIVYAWMTVVGGLDSVYEDPEFKQRTQIRRAKARANLSSTTLSTLKNLHPEFLIYNQMAILENFKRSLESSEALAELDSLWRERLSGSGPEDIHQTMAFKLLYGRIMHRIEEKFKDPETGTNELRLDC